MLRVLILLACLGPGAAWAEAVPEPEGYREAPYGAPVPEGLTGATTVGTEEARRLWEEGRVAFIDVLPRDPKPADLPEGTVWRDKPRDSIPGAIWLPNTGYAELSSEEQAYLEAGLSAATEGDPSRPVLFFCRPDCWMSWNAAKRAMAMGYEEVLWYPEGSDGWAGAGYETERAEPWEQP